MASDCTSGLSFDSGLTTSRAVPIVDGNVINEAVKSIPVGGNNKSVLLSFVNNDSECLTNLLTCYTFSISEVNEVLICRSGRVVL